MAQDEQNQSFDPVAELRKRYPGIGNEPDEKVHAYLSDPNNFRAAFPEYKDLDDDTIKRNMTEQPPMRPGPNGTMVRRPTPMTAEEAGPKVRKLEAEDPVSVSGQLGILSQELGEKSEAARLKELGNPEAGHYLTKGAGYDALSRLARIGAGATEPKSIAIGGAAVLAPEIVGPALVGHGLYTAGAHAPGALRGNPEEAEASLLGLSEAAAGGAAAGQGIGADVARLKAVHELTPIEANRVPQAAEFHPALANTPREVLEHASKEGIELTPGQATQAPVARMIQALGERSLFGADKLAEGMDRNAAAFMKSVRNFADRADPKAMGLSEEGAGEAIRQAAETAKDVAHQNAAQGYRALSEEHATEPVATQPITNAWMSLRESLPMGVEERILAEVPRNMRGSVEEMLSPTGMKTPLTFEQAIGLRSFFREMGDAEGLPNRLQGAFRKMSEATDRAMEATAKSKGFADAWRQANAGWKDYVTRYGDKQSPLYQITHQADPAKITRGLLNRASAADIETLQKEGMTAALDALKRQVVEDIARNKFGVGRNGLGGYSHSFLRTLFGDAATKELYLKSELGRRFNWQINPSGTGNVMVAEHQVTHPEPSKLGLLYGASKASMPREATSFIAGNTPIPTRLFPVGAVPPMLAEGAEESRRLLPARRAQ